MRGQEYDDFVEAFVSAVSERWPHVLLQWEDFANANAHRLLERYRDRLCTFNDDIQGTAAVAAAALLAAINVTGTKLAEQRIVLFGAGSAGCGIGTLLLKAMTDAGMDEAAARRNFFAVDRHGLLVDGMNDIHAAQLPFVQSRRAVADWRLHDPSRIDLIDVVANARPTALIAVSGQAGALTEPIVREMAQACGAADHLPAVQSDIAGGSNAGAVAGVDRGPRDRQHGKPVPARNWRERAGARSIRPTTRTSSRASGSACSRPMRGASPIRCSWRRRRRSPSCRRRGTTSPARLLPPVSELRKVALAVAEAVARQAQADGVAEPCDAGVLLSASARWCGSRCTGRTGASASALVRRRPRRSCRRRSSSRAGCP